MSRTDPTPLLLGESADVGIPEKDLVRQWQKLVDKFRGCAEPVIGKAQPGKVIEAVQTLDTAKDIAALIEAWA